MNNFKKYKVTLIPKLTKNQKKLLFGNEIVVESDNEINAIIKAKSTVNFNVGKTEIKKL